MAQKDTNDDGVINSQDANWSKLKVWHDLNQNGVSQQGELFTLDELGITGINTGYKKSGYYNDDNYHYGAGSYKLLKVFSWQVFLIWVIGWSVGWFGGVLSALHSGAMAYFGIIGGVIIIAIGYFIADKIVYDINKK